MPTLLDEPISTQTSPAGHPVVITWRGRYPIRVLRTRNARVYRLAATLATGAAIGEIARDETGWRLRPMVDVDERGHHVVLHCQGWGRWPSLVSRDVARSSWAGASTVAK